MPPAIVRHLPAPLRHWLQPAPDSIAAEHVRAGKSAWTNAVHLLWSAWVFVTPAFGTGYGVRWVALTCLSYPLFLLLYAKVYVAPRRAMWRYPVAMVLLGFALMPLYPSGISYYVFGCVMLPCQRGLPRYLLRLLAVNAVFVLLAWRIGYPWEVWAWMPLMTLIIGIIVNVERASHEKDAALKLSHEEVRRLAATAERERIGRDLHDLLGHTLSLITLKLELARKLSERDPAGSRRELEEAERGARQALAEVRSAVTGIRSSDLAAELASARLLLESSQVHLDYDAPPPGLPADIERGLALLLREAVTNIARHAQATRVRIAFACEPRCVQLCVGDDGRGGIAGDGNGLGGMRERVRALAGTLSIDSPRGRGTRVLVRLPLPAVAPADSAALPPQAEVDAARTGIAAPHA